MIHKALIENLINKRELFGAHRAIRRYLREADYSDESRFLAARYFRWMGEPKKSLPLLGKTLQARAFSAASPIQIKMQTEATRIIACLGAENMSMRILDRVYPVVQEASPESGAFIDLWNGHYERAFEYFGKFNALSDEELDYDNRNRAIFSAYCDSRLGRNERASSILKRVLFLSTEPLMIARCHSYLAMNFFYQGSYLDAKVEGEKADRLFHEMKDDTPDYGEALEHYGAALTSLGEYKLAEEVLDRAFKIFFQPGRSPSPWLNVVFWQGLIKHKRDNVFPLEWAQLLVSQAPEDFASRIAKYRALPEKMILSVKGPLKKPESVHYDLSTQVKTTVAEDGNVLHELGFTLVDKALCFLVCAGEHGTSELRFYDALWPDDFSTQQVDRRIAQVISRLRRQGHSIHWKSKHLTLESSSTVSVEWSLQPQAFGGTFLRGRKTFCRQEVQGFFSMSKSSALETCSKWFRQGLIKTVSKGSNCLYEVVSESKTH